MPQSNNLVGLLLVGDVHVGKWTPHFNIKVVGEQLKKVGKEVTQLAKEHHLKEVTVALLGDIVEGEQIYPAQEHFLDTVNPTLLRKVFPYLASLQEQASAHVLLQTFIAAQFLWHELIKPLTEHVKVSIAGVVGNHGAIRRSHPLSNYDAWCYLILDLLIKAEGGKVRMLTESQAYQVITLNGWRFLLAHGSDIKTWHGIPFYGIQKRTLYLMASKVLGEVHAVCLGHFHQTFVQLDIPAIFLTGTFILNDDYPIRRFGLPGSNYCLFLVVGSKSLCEAIYPINLKEGIKDEKP